MDIWVGVFVVCMWMYGLVCWWYVWVGVLVVQYVRGCMGWCVGGMYGLVCL